MKLFFIEDIECDIQNWQRGLNAKSYGIQWSNFLPKSISAEEARNDRFLRNYLEKHFYKAGIVATFHKWLKRNVNAERISKDLAKLTGKKIPFHSVYVYFTTFPRAPYDAEKGLFYLTVRPSGQKNAVRAIYHELMHFVFHKYYWDICEKEGLDNEAIHALKESLTVLLNPILKQRRLPLDIGYPNHQILRANLEKLWSGEKNFEVFLKKALSRYPSIRQQ